jgi:hypothetical protein
MAVQLYRYNIEFEERAPQYKSFTRPIELTDVSFLKSNFLVVPVEYESKLKEATEIMTRNGFIVSASVETASQLAVASFFYPAPGTRSSFKVGRLPAVANQPLDVGRAKLSVIEQRVGQKLDVVGVPT